MITEREFARSIIEETDACGVLLSNEKVSNYERILCESVSIGEEEVTDSFVRNEQVERDVVVLVDLLKKSTRWTDTEAERARLAEELAFFEDEKKLWVIMKLHKIVDKFQKDSIVWGVGRGSSCSSFVLYLLCVNDVNPMEYDIPFRELTKE